MSVRTAGRPDDSGSFGWRRVLGVVIAVGFAAVAVAVVIRTGLGPFWSWPTVAAALLFPAVMVALWLEERDPGRFPPWLSRALTLVAAKFSFVAWLVGQREIIKQNKVLLGAFEATLAGYELAFIPQEEADRLVGSGRLLTVGRLAREFGGVDGRPSKQALELLYRERYGMPRLNLWLAHRSDLAEELAPIVMRGDRIPAPAEGFPYSVGCLQMVMAHQRAFSIDVLAGTLRLLGELWRRMVRYRDFLAAAGATARSSSAIDVLQRIEAERGLPVNAETLYRLRDPGLAMQLLEACENTGEQELLRVVRRGLFLAEVDLDADRLKERVSRQAVRVDRLPELLHGYLVAKDRLRHVPLSTLASDWREWVDEARLCLGDDYLTEVTAVQSDLQGGYWPTVHRHIGRSESRPATTDETGFATLEDAIDDVPDNTVDALVPHLRGLVLDTVDFSRAVDELAERDAYMITFDSFRGPMRVLIDSLADEAFEKSLDGVGVRFRTAHGEQVYNFGPYTMQTRIGLVPRGWTFEQFHERLLRDFDRVFHNRIALFPGEEAVRVADDQYERVELTLNRIDLFHSRYLRYEPTFGDLFREASIENVYEAIASKAGLREAERLALQKLVDVVEGKRDLASV